GHPRRRCRRRARGAHGEGAQRRGGRRLGRHARRGHNLRARRHAGIGCARRADPRRLRAGRRGRQADRRTVESTDLATQPHRVVGTRTNSRGAEHPFAWWIEADVRARRAFIAASLGWMLDSFDVMLYSLVLSALMNDPVIRLAQTTAGALGSLTLVAAA